MSSRLDGKYKPGAPALDDAALTKLTNADIENLARSYLEHNPHLYRARIEDRSTNDQGDRVMNFKEGDIVHPRESDESDAQYLKRLFGILKDEYIKDAEEMRKTVQRAFSGGLLDEIRRTSNLGDEIRKSLGETWEAFKLPEMSLPLQQYATLRSVDPPPLPKPAFTLPEIVRLQLDAFEALGVKIDQLAEQFGKATGFSIASHQVQVGMAADLKTSSQENRRTGRINIVVTWVVILITALALITTWVQMHQESVARAGDEKSIANHVQTISGAIGAVKAQLEANGSKRSEVEELRERIDQLQGTINLQEQEIAGLKKQRSHATKGAGGTRKSNVSR